MLHSDCGELPEIIDVVTVAADKTAIDVMTIEEACELVISDEYLLVEDPALLELDPELLELDPEPPLLDPLKFNINFVFYNDLNQNLNNK